MPLILPGQRVIRPNPLAYPAGAVPRFNRAVPSGQVGRTLSVVAKPGNFVSLETYNAGTIAGTPSSKIDSLIGPCITFPTTEEIKFPFTVVNPASLVLAGIIRIPTSAGATGSTQYILGTFNAANGAQIFFSIGGDLSYFDFASNQHIMLAAGTPGLLGGAFFVIVSVVNSGTINWAVTNLSSGKVYTGSNSAVSGSGTESFFTLGNRDDAARPFVGGYIAAAAVMKDTILSVEELAQYANDPWSFWYPRSTIQYRTPATTTTSGGARIRQRWNRSPLAYPAGATPGIDRSHPAAQNCGFSGVAANGGIFKDILSGRIGSNATGPSTSTTSHYGSLGPVTNYVATIDNTSFPFVNSTTALTLAGIFKITATTGSGQYVLHTSAASSNGIGASINSPGSLGYIINGSVFDTTVAYDLEEPYFYAMSTDGTSVANWVVIKLRTGKIFSASAGVFVGIAAGDGSIWVGNRGANSRQLDGSIAAATASNAFMSQQQLLQWAQSPWEFWYPNKTINLASSTASAGASFLPVWAYRYNLPVLGTGNF